ncbi:MAG: malto-oligosyltrehalose synthase [Candidatus Methylophosphatis roskildensis]
MTDQPGLFALAARMGIAAEYQDIRDHTRHAEAAVVGELLDALGITADMQRDPQGALDALDDADWTQPLPPVTVLQHPVPSVRVRFRLPASRLAHRPRWRLLEEFGREHSGSLRLHPPEDAQRRTVNGVPHVAVDLEIAEALPPGYHRLELLQGQKLLGSMSLILAPRTCYQSDAVLEERRVWGPSLQLYAVRSEHNWGIGDFGDLRRILEQFADLGADVVGISPLHALFLGNPDHCSPYSPSSRIFLNPLYIDVGAVPEYADCAALQSLVGSVDFQVRLESLRATDLVDYVGVSAVKREAFELLYRDFRDRHVEPGSERAESFRTFQRNGDRALRRFALFETLWEHFHAADPDAWGWPQWPADFRDPESAAVRAFERTHLERVEFFEYLQWLADQQAFSVGERSAELGLGVGMYFDFAVSVDRNGADAWADQNCYARDLSIGAPPDEFNPRGQKWGLLPPIPQRLRNRGYAPFIAALRAVMRDAGALRIDHIMGLMQLFCIPPGRQASDGTYVAYDFDELLGIVTLESVRARCMVIGEDLGTVPDSVRAAMLRLGILAYRPLLFAKTASGEFVPAPQFPHDALVTVATHDMPTLAGFWQGQDLLLRTSLGLFDSNALREEQIVERSRERARLLLALEREALLPPTMTVNPISAPAMTPEFARAVHVFLARSPAKVMTVQLEDAFGLGDQANLPGSSQDVHPNWRRKLPQALELWPKNQPMAELASAVCGARGVLPRALRARASLGHLSVPRATYRLQLNSGFTFNHATTIVPYLARLGISHVYCSPYLRARPGSQHGYDIIDHNAFNPEIGSSADFERFAAALASHNLGQMIDVVPNHMGVMGSDNAWWLDVLENGEAAERGYFFDIDWEPIKPELRGKVLLPVLGDHYGTVLERGELKLAFDPECGEFSVWYYEHRFPVDPLEYPTILGRRSASLAARLGAEADIEPSFRSLTTAFGHLPARTETSAEKVAERSRDKEIHKRSLADMCRRCPPLAAFIAENTAEINGIAGNAASFNPLHELINTQAWRLAYWRVASDEINYRRFFDINDLAALRMENKEVFDSTHKLVLDLVAQGKVDCLRIDHPDGLYDPAQYFNRLQEPFLACAQSSERESGASEQRPPRPLYVVVEKIVAGYERLPESWSVHGTTGYRFMNVVNGLFVDSTAEARIERIYRGFVGEMPSFDDLLYRSKRLIVRTALAGELTVLANQLGRIAEASRSTCDFTLNSLRDALTEIVACFPVYRTYVTGTLVSEEDKRYIDWAVGAAKKRSRAADISVFDFVRDVLTTQVAEGRSDSFRAMVLTFAVKFQQFSSPVMAKGSEDTSFYIYNRLVSLNEVGGDPKAFGTTVSSFHGASQDRCRYWPHTMLASSTHDNKRSEDVRARINVLSEMPALWRLMLRRWSRINRSRRLNIDGRAAPSPNDEYLIYQTLLGIWPLDDPDEAQLANYCARTQEYMLKAVREAKVHTSWINPDQAYESALSDFIAALLTPSGRNRFLADFAPVARRVARFGMFNSLSQTLVKLASPGVPDIYQGNELFDLSLVDPDNRRPVDYGMRDALLRDLEVRMQRGAGDCAAEARVLLDSIADGRAKLYVTWRALEVRRRHERLFRDGDYLALAPAGQFSDHLCAFARRLGDEAVVVVAPRLYSRLLGERDVPPIGEQVWGDTEIGLGPLGLVAGSLYNEFSGEEVRLHQSNGTPSLSARQALSNFPVALLTLLTPVSNRAPAQTRPTDEGPCE